MPDGLRVARVSILQIYNRFAAFVIVAATILEMSVGYARLLVDLRRKFCILKFSMLSKLKK